MFSFEANNILWFYIEAIQINILLFNFVSMFLYSLSGYIRAIKWTFLESGRSFKVMKMVMKMDGSRGKKEMKADCLRDEKWR